MTNQRKTLGAFGERYTVSKLLRAGYRILGRNIRLASGEIDIVAQDNHDIVFVEVRTRRSSRFGSPEESITQGKARRLAVLGSEYVEAHGKSASPWRIDIAALEVDRRGLVSRFDLHKNAVAA